MVEHISYIRQLKLISHDAEISDLPIRFFEYEWKLKNDLCKSMLDYKEGNQSISRLYARNTLVKEVGQLDAKTFLEENHIQGYARSSIRLGLYYDNALISLMTFSKPRYSKEYQYELIRFCTKKYFCVVGGASKLLKHFETVYKPRSLLSYANKRWSEGHLYLKLGFTLSHMSPPSYFYYKFPDLKLYHRTIFQKHKLSKLLNSFDDTLTETQNMLNNGYRKIYDQGNFVFTKVY